VKGKRHPDFERFYQDFIEIRGALNGPIMYLQFLEQYGLDERISYSLTAQKRLKEMALKSPKHLSIKKQYPQIDWDRFITGRTRGRLVKVKTDQPVKLRVRNLGGRPIRVTIGGGEY